MIHMSGGSTVLDEAESVKKYPKKLFDSRSEHYLLSVDRGLELLEVQAVQFSRSSTIPLGAGSLMNYLTWNFVLLYN